VETMTQVNKTGLLRYWWSDYETSEKAEMKGDTWQAAVENDQIDLDARPVVIDPSSRLRSAGESD